MANNTQNERKDIVNMPLGDAYKDKCVPLYDTYTPPISKSKRPDPKIKRQIKHKRLK
jgi:hypothetical protein